MIEVETQVRKWGRSLGVVIPKEKIRDENIKADETVRLLIAKKSSVLKDTFGSMEFKKSTDKILEESDKELYNE